MIDVDTGRTQARLPASRADIGGRHALRLQFVDDDRKLLAITATLGEGYESASLPSNLQFAVWDLSRRTLFSLRSVADASLGSPQTLFTDFSATTGALHWIDDERSMKSIRSQPQARPAPLELMQAPAGDCAASATARYPIDAWDGSGLALDPHGRWIAGVRVFELAARREIAQIEIADALALQDVQRLAGSGLVVVETIEDAPQGSRRKLRAYAVPH